MNQEHDFAEGEEYELDELPANDHTTSGELEDSCDLIHVGDGVFEAKYGDTIVEFELSKIRCVAVRDTSEYPLAVGERDRSRK